MTTPDMPGLLNCGLCCEEQGEEVHPHPECPIGKTGTPARYRLRSDEEIEAVQWTGRNADQLRAFCGPDFDTIDPEDRAEDPDQDAQLLSDASHWVGMKPGDWVLKHVDHFTATSDEAFRAVWEPAAAVLPPADRPILRDRIAAALLARIKQATVSRTQPHDALTSLLAANEYDLADAVLAVLPPPADRVAVLRDFLWRLEQSAGDAAAEKFLDDNPELRRMADKAQQPDTEPRPARGDQFEAWLKAFRDACGGQTDEWHAFDAALDRYRLHADTGTPLGEHVCEGQAVGDCECLEQPAAGARQDGAQS